MTSREVVSEVVRGDHVSEISGILDDLLAANDIDFTGQELRIKNFITSQLLLMTTDSDPRIKIKALELLGRTSKINIFSGNNEAIEGDRTLGEIDGDINRILSGYVLDDKVSKYAPTLPLDEKNG